MAPRPIQNCQVRFQFKCPQQWEALQETAEAGVRLCGECHKQVYLCQSTQEAAEHARAGHCVAAPAGLVSSDGPRLQLQGLEIDPELFKLVSREMASKYGLVPVSRAGPTLTVALSEFNRIAVDDVRFVTGYNVEVVLATKQDIQETLERAYREPDTIVELGVMYCPPEEPEPEPEPEPSEMPMGTLLRMALLDAHEKRVAQVQIDITKARVVIRHGLEGNRKDAMSAPAKLGPELLRQLRQAKGQLHLQSRGQRIVYQVSINPTAQGQEVILQPLS